MAETNELGKPKFDGIYLYLPINKASFETLLADSSADLEKSDLIPTDETVEYQENDNGRN